MSLPLYAKFRLYSVNNLTPFEVLFILLAMVLQDHRVMKQVLVVLTSELSHDRLQRILSAEKRCPFAATMGHGPLH